MARPISAFCTLAPLFFGCGALDFDLAQPIDEQVVKGEPIAAAAGQFLSVGGMFSNPLTFDIDVQSETQARHTGPASSVILKSLTLEMSGDSATPSFDFLDEVHIYVESRLPDSSLPRVEIATLTAVPRGQGKLEFQTHGEVNLLPYVNEGTKVTTSAKARVPAKDAVFAGTLVFRIRPT